MKEGEVYFRHIESVHQAVRIPEDHSADSEWATLRYILIYLLVKADLQYISNL
jgi:hypothetical protein